ncbi:MAG TPA: sulfotransferase [Phycisphaerales bacterium]|nr:sulfotransferase [Phycisphaerales bacterium]
MPSGHFMGLAPLDAWVRLLASSRRGVAPRYWLRLAVALFTSTFATAITLPERVALGPLVRMKFRGRAPRFVPRRDAVVILGYFRSGTTHLHNLLATHPDLVTPKWVQAMSPQGFWLSWALLRWISAAFLPNTRPQDEVAFGPDWPAEDDFAHNNWALASSLPGRLVLVQERERWGRFNALEGLKERELVAWRRAMAAFAWKVCVARTGRGLLLKTPSHTARVRELDRVFGSRVRFVHITRNPEDVVKSNVAMHARLEGQALQPLPSPGETREAIVAEYVDTERRFLADAGAMRLEHSSRLVRMRYDDLVAAPMTQLERTCATLGLRWDDEVRGRMARYLTSVGDYTPRTHAPPAAGDPRLLDLAAALEAGLPPPVAVREAVPTDERAPAGKFAGIVGAWLAAGACLTLWLGLARVTGLRWDILVWPLGGLVGVAALRVAGRGDWKLGLWSAAAALAMVLGSIWPLPAVANDWTGPDRVVAIRNAYGSPNNNYVWIAFGLLSAYRYASRKFLKPPGM